MKNFATLLTESLSNLRVLPAVAKHLVKIHGISPNSTVEHIKVNIIDTIATKITPDSKHAIVVYYPKHNEFCVCAWDGDEDGEEDDDHFKDTSEIFSTLFDCTRGVQRGSGTYTTMRDLLRNPQREVYLIGDDDNKTYRKPVQQKVAMAYDVNNVEVLLKARMDIVVNELSKAFHNNIVGATYHNEKTDRSRHEIRLKELTWVIDSAFKHLQNKILSYKQMGFGQPHLKDVMNEINDLIKTAKAYQ